MIFYNRILMIAALIFGSLYQAAFGQVELRRGAFFTEEQGKVELEKNIPVNLAEWEQRRELVKANLRKGMELEQMPEFVPLKPVIYRKWTMDGYTIENVYFETLPGIYVTGNLYRPTQKLRSYAGILCSHGHGNNPDGRFMEQTQVRSAMLAKMGAVVFAWDMIGHGDSQQCNHKIPKALKLQTLNNLRTLDFLLSIPEVDPKRIGMTGESGGGTQTFMLMAMDPRITVAAPCVMVSAHFFGGCACESGMPVHKQGNYATNNVEITAVTAPKPMLLISNGNDWTKNNPEVEFPYLQKIYGLYGKESLVEHTHLPEEGHDYGPSKRAALYPFMAKHLDLDIKKIKDKKGQFMESGITILSPVQLSVFDANHPHPQNYLKGDDAVSALLD
jgi:dienelactone hydrolase